MIEITDEKLSEHFWLSELCHSDLAARNNIDNTPEPLIVQSMRNILAPNLEVIREHLGGHVMSISSGYRCIILNRMLGSKDSSAHPKGLGADFNVRGYGTPLQVATELSKLPVDVLPYDQLIHEFGSWTHAGFAEPGAAPRRMLLTIDKFGTRAGLHEIRTHA